MSWFNEKRIFLDYASATPVLHEVKNLMEDYWSRAFYNPSAIYKEGLLLKKDLEDKRTRVARLLGAAKNSVIFTSGGTEADNLAILGTFEESLAMVKKPHVIVSSVEHPAIIAAAEEVVRRGGEMSLLPVDEFGMVNLQALRKLLKRNTVVVSVGFANHEVGTIQPIAKIGRIIREYRTRNKSIYPYLHSDASQAPNFLPINIESLQSDLLTLDGSKIYGPKGVGVLVVRTGVKIRPILLGGMQEGGKRAGTPNMPLIVGFVRALEIAQRDSEKESKRIESHRKIFIEKVTKLVPNAIINGSEANTIPNIVSVSVPGILAEFVLLKLDRKGLMASVGSACSLDERMSGSDVLRAMGKPELAESTIRFSFGRFTTKSDVISAAKIFGQSL